MGYRTEKGIDKVDKGQELMKDECLMYHGDDVRN